MELDRISEALINIILNHCNRQNVMIEQQDPVNYFLKSENLPQLKALLDKAAQHYPKRETLFDYVSYVLSILLTTIESADKVSMEQITFLLDTLESFFLNMQILMKTDQKAKFTIKYNNITKDVNGFLIPASWTSSAYLCNSGNQFMGELFKPSRVDENTPPDAIKKLVADLAAVSRLRSLYQETFKQLDELRKEYESLSKDKSDAQEQLSKEIAKLQTQLSDIQKQLKKEQDKTAQLAQHEKSIDELQAELALSRSQLEREQEKNLQLTEQQEALRQTYNELQRDHQNICSEHALLAQKVSKQTDIIKKLEVANEELSEAFSTYKSEHPTHTRNEKSAETSPKKPSPSVPTGFPNTASAIMGPRYFNSFPLRTFYLAGGPGLFSTEIKPPERVQADGPGNDSPLESVDSDHEQERGDSREGFSLLGLGSAFSNEI